MSAQRHRTSQTLAAILLMGALAAPTAQAGVAVTLGDARAEFANFTGPNGVCAHSTSCIYGSETFAGWQGGGFTSSFMTGPYSMPPGTSLTGTYAGAISYDTDNTYGGAYGTQPYPSANGTGQYTLSLATNGIPGANYFGVWITAMDDFNTLTLSSHGTPVFSFVSSDLRRAVAATANAAAYYGDPDNGRDTGEPFAYVNVFDTGGTFDQVTFSNNGSSNFESSNHAVAYLAMPNVSGPPVAITTNTVPEPDSLALLLPALGLLMVWHGRRTGGI